jgi:hypothetical protein
VPEPTFATIQSSPLRSPGPSGPENKSSRAEPRPHTLGCGRRRSRELAGPHDRDRGHALARRRRSTRSRRRRHCDSQASAGPRTKAVAPSRGRARSDLRGSSGAALRSLSIALGGATVELCLGWHCCSVSRSDGPTRRWRVRLRTKLSGAASASHGGRGRPAVSTKSAGSRPRRELAPLQPRARFMWRGSVTARGIAA